MNKQWTRAAMVVTAGLGLALAAPVACAEDSRPDFLSAVKVYADAMIKDGRDSYGKESSPLFASTLDRKTMKLATAEQVGEIDGLRIHDRHLIGGNPQLDRVFYETLYELSRVTGDSRYAAEADKSLAFFLARCQSPATGLLAWGEHMDWDFNREGQIGGLPPVTDTHEMCGEWMLWDACYRLAPDACWNFAIGLWDHQIFDKQTGDFSRHAGYSKHAPESRADFPRYAGQMIATWADAYTRLENADRDRLSDLLEAIRTVVGRMEANEKKVPSGHLPASEGADFLWLDSNIEFIRCLGKSVPAVDDPALAERMRALALRQDAKFLGAPHKLNAGGGFAATLDTATGQPRDRGMNRPYTETWDGGYGFFTHAMVANRCYARCRQIERSHPDLAGRYRVLILAAADRYCAEDPPEKGLQLKPSVFADVIVLLLNAHDMTGDKKYRDRADHVGSLGMRLFLDDGLPLPKASSQHSHYESITGGPEFMRALLRLAHTQKSDARPATPPAASPDKT